MFAVKVLATFVLKEQKLHRYKSSRERKFLERKFHRNESSLCLLFTLNNKSSAEQKVQIPSRRHLSLCPLQSVECRWTVLKKTY